LDLFQIPTPRFAPFISLYSLRENDQITGLYRNKLLIDKIIIISFNGEGKQYREWD